MSLTSNQININPTNEEVEQSLSRKGNQIDLLNVKDSKRININENNPFKDHDYGIIIKAFEVQTQNWEEEDYALSYHYKDVYSTKEFSTRVRNQMNYYPGMHQKDNVPEEDPFKTEQEKNSTNTLNFWNSYMDSPEAFGNGLRSRQEDFDYTTIFGDDHSAKERATEVGKMMTECIPCFDELLDMNALLPNGDLLEIHAMNIKIRTDILDKVNSLFDDPGAFIDICELLNLFSHICPRQLLAIVAMLTQYLAKLNIDINFNIDFIVQLVGPILSPFLDSLSQWLDMWIQIIMKPIICIIDNINETIAIAQNMKVPFSEVNGNASLDIGVAAPLHKNVSAEQEIGGSAATGNDESPQGAEAWGSFQWEQFNTPSEERYNPSVPEYPVEETNMAKDEMKEAWKPSFTEEERKKRDDRWAELRATEETKRKKVPAPLRRETRDGTRWSKDNIPNSEKHTKGNQFDASYYPPEEQSKPTKAIKYIDPAPIVNSVVQLRNILQGAVQYVEDWFTYVTQMIYDLLGTEVGWMSKKTDTTMLKSRIIQLILIVKAILRSIKKNGLQCGNDSNYGPDQMRYILEEELNNDSSTRFSVNDDGTVTLQQSDSQNTPRTAKLSAGLTPDQTVNLEEPAVEEPVSSGVIIKSCFKNLSDQELDNVKSWIADFARRGSI